MDFSIETEPLSDVTNLADVKTGFYAKVKDITAGVRMMATPSNVPYPNTALDAYLKSLQLDTATCAQYADLATSLLNGAGIAARTRNTTLTGTAYESHALVEYYDPFDDKWSATGPTFGLFFFDESTGVGQSVEEISALVNSGRFSDIHFEFLTPQANLYTSSYYLDPSILFANPVPVGKTVAESRSVPNPPEAFMNQLHLQTMAGTAGVFLFRFQSISDSVTIDDNGTAINLTPLNGTLWSKAVDLDKGWTITDGGSSVELFQTKRFIF